MQRPPSESLYVDMGLPSGTLWAVSNLDISSPGKFQPTPYQYDCSFVSWGNIDAHNPISETEFDYDFGGVNAQAPWYEGQPYGSTPGAALTTNIPLSLDVARRELGWPWRMPTKDDFMELLENCRYIDAEGNPIPSGNPGITIEGVNGYMLQSKINGKSIFFAKNGWVEGNTWTKRGDRTRINSSSISDEKNCWVLFQNVASNQLATNQYPKYLGLSVRPVWNPRDKR